MRDNAGKNGFTFWLASRYGFKFGQKPDYEEVRSYIAKEDLKDFDAGYGS